MTHLLDTENLVNGDKKKNAMVRGFLEYHASQIETIKILGYESIGENISFSMKQQVETVASIKSMQNFVDNSPFIQVTPSTINEILVSIPSDRMQELARLTFQAGHNTSQPIQIDRMNEFLREDKSINSEEHPFQSLMIEEFLGNIKMEKRT